MLKSMSSVLMLVILCGGLQLSHGEKLKCEFKDQYYHVVSYLYQCYVTSLDNSFDNMSIDGYSGTLSLYKNVNDVKAIFINGANLKYIPHGLGYLFNLKGLAIYSSELIEIRSKDFQGMQNLEYLSFYNNKLTSVPSDTFSSLPKLKVIDLRNNQIKYFGSGAFDQLMNLGDVYLEGNICVNKNYDGATAITEMKEDIKVNCVEKISTSTTTTTTTTTTTQNPMEVEIEALKNEAKEQQQRNEIELNKLRDDLKKEQMENLKVKNEKDILMINYDVLTQDKDALKMIIDTLLKEKDVWIKENDELKLELNNKTSKINELKKDKDALLNEKDVKLNEFIGTKKNQEDLKKMIEQLLNSSQEHQMECNEIIKLRAELVTAKDELKMANDQQEKEQETKTIVTNERDQLKKELSEAMSLIAVKLPKMEQLIEDFYMEVMDLKIERHNERQNSIALRSKLMEANEQLAECQINERISC